MKVHRLDHFLPLVFAEPGVQEIHYIRATPHELPTYGGYFRHVNFLALLRR